MLLHVTDVLSDGDFPCDPIYLERGKHVHEACHLHDTVGLDLESVHEPWRGFVLAYQTFLKECHAEVLYSELEVQDLLLGYTGTLDKVFRFPKLPSPFRERLWVGDLKTGSIPPWVGKQTAAYRAALQKKLPAYSPMGRCVVLLKADGTYSFDMEWSGRRLFRALDFEDFVAALTVKRREMEAGRWFPREREG